MPNVYQVKGFAFANTFFVKSDTSWTFFDPFTCVETARATLELVNRHLGEFPLKEVIYSHSHCDHWRSAHGGVEMAARAGKVEIIAPRYRFSDRWTALHADCQAISRCISGYMDDGQGWIC